MWCRRAFYMGSTASQVPEELLTAEVEEICGPTISGGTLREVMWLCAFMEFWQLVLDITHVQLDKLKELRIAANHHLINT